MSRRVLLAGGLAAALAIAVPLTVMAAIGSSGSFLPQNDVYGLTIRRLAEADGLRRVALSEPQKSKSLPAEVISINRESLAGRVVLEAKAMQIADTPKGKLILRNHQLSAPSTRENKPFSALMLMLFSEAGRKPVSRINTRPNRIGAKKVMFA